MDIYLRKYEYSSIKVDTKKVDSNAKLLDSQKSKKEKRNISSLEYAVTLALTIKHKYINSNYFNGNFYVLTILQFAICNMGHKTSLPGGPLLLWVYIYLLKYSVFRFVTLHVVLFAF
jgi:hypothetical protein